MPCREEAGLHHNTTQMTRWLLLVLMVLLPAQFSWAAAAPYCTHERNPTTFHVGHHAHVHQGSKSDAQPTPSEAEPEPARSPVAPDHADCSFCHGMVGQFAAPVELQFELPAQREFISASRTLTGNGRETSIERPKWTRAA